MSQQSPIDIRNPIYADFGDGKLKIKWNSDVYGHIHKGDHGMQVLFASDCRQYIELSGKQYHLRQFHFHHPSEHWVDGSQHAMELHVVHQNSHDGSLAVIGIFIDPGKTKDPVHKLLTQIASISFAGSNTKDDYHVSFDPNDFLPKDWKKHYRYEGSLTTPPYSENVSWVVIKDSFEVNETELSELLEIFESEARFPEPLNRRYILSTFKEDDKPKGKK
ncbi:carbonic anhydrase family protein [Gimesia chilikensis]|uniref:Carbonic anhydrase n=1 Tax=Gimesia chilikensis TaxID=2605989 RepID=A0A517PYE1_9PLAN|nr:carbonic anhydrase family protein [Gimesia chilikensis]QDT24408.1 Carbonic anhydrase precursor [Gimesia chilikensis]